MRKSKKVTTSKKFKAYSSSVGVRKREDARINVKAYANFKKQLLANKASENRKELEDLYFV